MLSKSSNWIIAAGAVEMFMGLCVLPDGMMGEHPDPNSLAVAACLFSMGALAIAGGIYLKARVLQSKVELDAPAPKRRVKGGCELCGGEAPVIACKVHQLQLCSECLAEHYDVRSCSYVPPRKPATKGGKQLAARARG